MQRFSRRAAMALICFLLVITGYARPAKAIIGPSDITGVYEGFFQSLAMPGLWGSVTFEINNVRNRRWEGVVTMLVPSPPSSPIPIPYPVVGTISASGEFTGAGKSDAGMVQFHGQIALIAGGAAIADATYRLQPPDPGMPGADDGTATLLRGYPSDPENTPPPNVSGDWNGSFASFGRGGTGSFMLDNIMQGCKLDETGKPMRDSMFAGTEMIEGFERPFYFQGSIAGDGMFAVIGWDPAGDHFIVTGDYQHPPDPGKPASAEGVYAMMFANGMTDRGRLFDWTQEAFPPDPCRIDIIEGPK